MVFILAKRRKETQKAKKKGGKTNTLRSISTDESPKNRGPKYLKKGEGQGEREWGGEKRQW